MWVVLGVWMMVVIMDWLSNVLALFFKKEVLSCIFNQSLSSSFSHAAQLSAIYLTVYYVNLQSVF